MLGQEAILKLQRCVFREHHYVVNEMTGQRAAVPLEGDVGLAFENSMGESWPHAGYEGDT
jgi:hypothetical protein